MAIYPQQMNVKQSASVYYDEVIEVSGAEEVETPHMSAEEHSIGEGTLDSYNQRLEMEQPKTNKDQQWEGPDRGLIAQLSDHTDNSDEEDEDDDDVRAPILQGGYDPNEFEELAESAEVKELFSHITKYVPQNIDLETKLAPFLPDFIPAVGDVDGFLKIPRPDGKTDNLGLTVLDEPCTNQTDPAVLQLQLKAQAKQPTKTLVVKKVLNADSNTKPIDKWISAINDLHQRRPPPTVHYTKPMPNIDNLMQEWPGKIEQLFDTMTLPSHDLDCDLETYVTIICNIFDIPVYGSKIQSLHMFFNLYSTMKSTKSQIVQESEESQQVFKLE